MDRHIHPDEAFLLEPVHFGGERISSLLASADEGVEERVLLAAGRDVERTAVAAIGIAAALACFGALEIGQDIGIGPAGEAVARPTVIVEGVTPDIDHGVERGRAAEHAAA